MTQRVTPAELYEQFSDRLDLRWICGKSEAGRRELEPTGFTRVRPWSVSSRPFTPRASR